jgi:hypothetical protein
MTSRFLDWGFRHPRFTADSARAGPIAARALVLGGLGELNTARKNWTVASINGNIVTTGT